MVALRPATLAPVSTQVPGNSSTEREQSSAQCGELSHAAVRTRQKKAPLRRGEHYGIPGD